MNISTEFKNGFPNFVLLFDEIIEFFRILVSHTKAIIAFPRIVFTSSGVPFGTATPLQVPEDQLIPCSFKVGISGNLGSRSSDMIAKAFNCPAAIWGQACYKLLHQHGHQATRQSKELLP